jgi:glucose/arabinose dehydrogenase
MAQADSVGNGLRTAQLIAVTPQSRSYRDAVGGSDRRDVYRFRFKTPHSFNLVLNGLTARASVQLLNQAGSIITASDQPGNHPKSIYQNLGAGVYYIRIGGNQQETNYNLNVSAFPERAGDRSEDARNLGTLTNTTVRDWVGKSDPNDYYSFTVLSPTQLTARISGLSSNVNLQLLNGTNPLLQTVVTPTTSDALNLPLAPGDYYLRINKNTRLGASYILALTTADGIPAPTPNPTPTPGPSPTPSPTPTPTPPGPIPTISLSQQFQGFKQPTLITNARDGSNRLFVVQQDGTIQVAQNGTVLPTPFLDIHDRVLDSGEQGLLSVAFPADYSSKQQFYVYYTNKSGNNVVARYQVGNNPNVANANSEQIVLTLNHPTYTNHNGGQLSFGPDGYLYIGTGDGGGGGDPNKNAQNPNSLLGKILRIDVESPGTTTYTIPATNPFFGDRDPGNVYRDEIWALGLRNPWRFSFDRQTGDLYIGDVGQGAYEEIDVQPATSQGGENYGWNILEGNHRYNNSTGAIAGFTPPVTEYDHSQGESVTGGYVYRGTAPNLQGVYLYGDFGSGRIWGLRRNGNIWENKELLDSSFNISTFGQDEQGNVYLADYSTGTIYKIVPN